MYLMLEDQETTLKTRLVVSGCDSFTAGLINMVSELLESVANSVEDPYELISSENMLARIHECNLQMKTIPQKLQKEAEENNCKRPTRDTGLADGEVIGKGLL